MEQLANQRSCALSTFDGIRQEMRAYRRLNSQVCARLSTFYTDCATFERHSIVMQIMEGGHSEQISHDLSLAPCVIYQCSENPPSLSLISVGISARHGSP